MKILFVDDSIDRHSFVTSCAGENDVWHAMGFEDALFFLKEEKDFDLVSLDYNLEGYQTGNDIAKWMVDELEYQPAIHIHSMDSSGAREIEFTFRKGGWKCPDTFPFYSESFHAVWEVIRALGS